MNVSAFLTTMIDVLKYDKKYTSKRDALLPILRRSRLVSQQTTTLVKFGRSGQCYEDIELRIPVPLLDEANAALDDIRELVRYVYEESDAYRLRQVVIRPEIHPKMGDEYIEHTVQFNKIQETIIQGIRDAKYTIWAAIAWFTNHTIINELVAKKQKGVNVRIVISQESENAPYYKQLDEQFDMVILPRHGYRDWNRMHDKFCIIDFDYVMHGSYNWTRVANYNDETLATAIDREFVRKFADEFLRLYNDGEKYQYT